MGASFGETTAMQELLDKLNNINPNNGNTRLLLAAIKADIEDIFLEKEKQQLDEAYKKGYLDTIIVNTKK